MLGSWDAIIFSIPISLFSSVCDSMVVVLFSILVWGGDYLINEGFSELFFHEF